MTAESAILVISPHFDDAVLSTGFWLSQHPGATVATVFSGLPGPGVSASDWDRAGGFDSGNDAALARRIEDQNALNLLGATQRCLGFLDHPYRTTERYHESNFGSGEDIRASVAEAIHQLLEELQPEECLYPLGLEHPDHVITSDAAQRVLIGKKTTAVMYADLPYVFVDPRLSNHRMRQLADRGLRLRELTPSEDASGNKQAAAECYVSQRTLTNMSGCFGPDSERLYRIE